MASCRYSGCSLFYDHEAASLRRGPVSILVGAYAPSALAEVPKRHYLCCMAVVKNPFDVILFDLGGVLVRWEGVEGLARLSGGALTLEQSRDHWLRSEWVRRFEKGGCTARDFARGVVGEFGLTVEPSIFLEKLRSWDRGPFPGARELLELARQVATIACLTNNNEIHWPKLRDEFGLGTLFERSFVSHEIGMMKPDPEIYQYAIAELGVPAERILFLDDTRVNTEGAEACGIQTETVQGVEAARAALIRRGVLAG